MLLHLRGREAKLLNPPLVRAGSPLVLVNRPGWLRLGGFRVLGLGFAAQSLRTAWLIQCGMTSLTVVGVGRFILVSTSLLAS